MKFVNCHFTSCFIKLLSLKNIPSKCPMNDSPKFPTERPLSRFTSCPPLRKLIKWSSSPEGIRERLLRTPGESNPFRPSGREGPENEPPPHFPVDPGGV